MTPKFLLNLEKKAIKANDRVVFLKDQLDFHINFITENKFLSKEDIKLVIQKTKSLLDWLILNYALWKT